MFNQKKIQCGKEWVESVERNVLHLAQLAEGEAVSLAIRIVTSNAEAELAGYTLVGFCLFEGEQELCIV